MDEFTRLELEATFKLEFSVRAIRKMNNGEILDQCRGKTRQFSRAALFRILGALEVSAKNKERIAGSVWEKVIRSRQGSTTSELLERPVFIELTKAKYANDAYRFYLSSVLPYASRGLRVVEK